MPHDPEVAQWTVLIVDDEPDNVAVANKILSFFGAQVHTAPNGREGLKALETVKPTFILLDLSMPVMDGWQMIKELRSRPETATTPVIALTAHAMQGDRERVLTSGFDDYVPKPFRLETFLSDLKRSINTTDRHPVQASTASNDEQSPQGPTIVRDALASAEVIAVNGVHPVKG